MVYFLRSRIRRISGLHFSLLKEWLEGVVFDDPVVSDRVKKILHPEHFKEKKPSVLRKLEKKKDELNTAKQRTSVTQQRKRRAPDL